MCQDEAYPENPDRNMLTEAVQPCLIPILYIQKGMWTPVQIRRFGYFSCSRCGQVYKYGRMALLNSSVTFNVALS
jgi:hypothetical protein